MLSAVSFEQRVGSRGCGGSDAGTASGTCRLGSCGGTLQVADWATCLNSMETPQKWPHN